ncbi:protein FAM135B-like isoform X1 [Salvia hispanica]|uniref:protein FAM135B-like isoform X1 n=2 Tax=Salvia hispanica TaxID=49212 RepID=UPI00200945FF|nr:protein FAM135B-like isoform X1 [Salvia hispanica]XP_047968007.1 protein FAM135B-like isoform X1 [Salvia hispanica]
MVEAVHEIAIYIHRFHNLDLFQQGWYQIKVTMRWEDEDYGPVGTPARVIQYEAPDLDSDYVHGIWRIDDVDHSFSTHPFRIKYAKQDVPLSMMVTFNLSPSTFEVPCTSAVILTFELLYSPVLESRDYLEDSLDNTAAVHEFRIPPKALFGLHVYCPVHFDAFHAVLVDVTVHVSLLKMDRTSSLKVPSDPTAIKDDIREYDNSKQVMLVHALSCSSSILLEDLKMLGQSINKPIDLDDIASRELFASTQGPDQEITDAEVSGQISRKIRNFSEKLNGEDDFYKDKSFQLSEVKLLELIDLLCDQVSYLWSIFLKFHRANKRMILEYLRSQWVIDRKSEWSMWIVRTKVKMPEQYIGCWVDKSSYHPVHGRPAIPQKITGDPAQTAANQAGLLRQSIATMMIENRSIQDMYIFGDPSHVPIVIVEDAVNAPIRVMRRNSYISRVDQNEKNGFFPRFGTDPENALVSTRPDGRSLRIVIFVHGFQGHHLDLRLIRNQWLLIDPKVEFLMSEVNEEKTSGDFREMGQRLAKEVVSFVKKKMDKMTRSGVLGTIKISFVGHSIGNIILRTALTDSIMEPYLGYLHTYLSVSGPHLGYLYSSNSLFNGGLWLMKKLKGTPCIHQLTFTDDNDLENTFLYKLCKQRTFENFRNVILLSSPQDGYVPYHSARIEMCPASSGDKSKKGKVFLEMLNECLDQIRAKSSETRVFMRCDVNFNLSAQGKSIDTMIGRAAHIEFLDSDIFAKFIMWSFPELFR